MWRLASADGLIFTIDESGYQAKTEWKSRVAKRRVIFTRFLLDNHSSLEWILPSAELTSTYSHYLMESAARLLTWVAKTRLQGDTSGWLKPPVDLVLESYVIWWAAVVATYCPTAKTDASPCTTIWGQFPQIHKIRGIHIVGVTCLHNEPSTLFFCPASSVIRTVLPMTRSGCTPERICTQEEALSKSD